MYTIREALKEDLKSIAIVHKEQFTENVSGLFSLGRLSKFYESYQNLGVFMFVATYESEVHGFVMGGESATLSKAQNLFLKTNAIGCFIDLVMSPTMYLRILKTVRRTFIPKRKCQPSTGNETLGPSIWLLSISVDEASKSKGAAKSLMDAFDRAVHSKFGGIEYRLAVRKENGRAIRFYTKLGWQIDRETEETYIMLRSAVQVSHEIN